MIQTAVVILNWNGKNYLEKFLPSVIEHSQSDNVDIYVVDNGSDDDSVRCIKTKFSEVKQINFDENYGFAGGYNKALRMIKAEYYVILNSDIEVGSNWLFPALKILYENNDIAAVSPKIKSYVNKQNFEYAGAAGGFIDKYGYPFCRGRIISKTERDEGQYDNESEIFWASGACLFIKADLFHEVGGFDEIFFAHMEEIDLCWRLKNRGFKIVYTPKSEVYHVGGGALPVGSPYKIFLNYRNNLLLLFKNLPQKKANLIILKRLILDSLSAFVYLSSFKFSFFFAVIKAHFSFYSLIGSYQKKRKKLLKYNNKNHKEIYNKSIVFDFYLRKKQKFTDLVNYELVYT